MPARPAAAPVDPESLSVSHLAHFVGVFANRLVLLEMKRAGFGDLRESHGYLVQHLLREPHSVGQLSKRLGVSQQAVSKTVAELTRSGYVESHAGEDARVKVISLSDRGHEAVHAGRRIRDRLERRLRARLGERRSSALRAALLELLQELGGTEAVKGRRVPSGEAQR